ncbi:hypothetical protein Taro_021043 [Colocasia esculenta]|uniref:Uncharacterized protein n=1 Tax=Colocasia esculenta TaxID=4460 RepID=A0A843UXX9_COLES|nr:hypothetical protein [Colocasia esculenta]
MSMGSPPHALVLPYPAQGHVIPLMELSHRLVDLGFAVTFVTTEHTHRQLLAALPEPPAAATPTAARSGRLRLVAIPDGLPPGDDRADIGRLTEAIQRAMPGHLEELIRKTNELGAGAGGGGITCVVADQGMAWALGVAKKMDLRAAAFWPASAWMLAIILSIPKLLEDGIIDQEGRLRGEGEFQLAVGMPAMNHTHLAWNYCGDAAAQSIMFHYFQSLGRATESSEFILCNSFPEIEGPVFAYAPRILPVGPLLAGHRRRGDFSGHFLPQDPGCAAWLDGQLPGSVIYAAFGSSTVLGRHQFQELARGLELSGRPFLWVARPGLAVGESTPFPEGFEQRVGFRGRVVGWAPQQEVLAHPGVACFVSHCGWNSAVEGAASGVPFLCWPYFGDQFANRDYICGVWGTGLSVAPGGDGVVTAEEIRGKLEALLGNEGIRGRALLLREAAGRSAEGGVGCQNLKRFVEAMKA